MVDAQPGAVESGVLGGHGHRDDVVEGLPRVGRGAGPVDPVAEVEEAEVLAGHAGCNRGSGGAVPGPASAILAGMSEQWSEKDIELANRLFDMARDGDTAQLKAYLDAGVSTRLRNHAGDSFLTLAAYHEHPDTVAMLIEAGAEIEHANDRGQRPLTCATFKRDVASMRHLLAAGADPDAGTPSARQTAQMFAGDDLLAVLDGGDAAPSSEA